MYLYLLSGCIFYALWPGHQSVMVGEGGHVPPSPPPGPPVPAPTSCLMYCTMYMYMVGKFVWF